MCGHLWSYYGAAFGSFLAWMSIYLVLRIVNGHVPPEFTNRLVTVLHGTLISTISAAEVLSKGLCVAEFVQPNSSVQNAILVVSLGYFVFDFLWCVIESKESRVMLAHHVISIIGYLYVLQQGIYGCETVTVVAISELTNPFVQLRWFLKYYGNQSRIVAIIVDCTLALAFWLLRMVLGTILLFYYVQKCQEDMLATVFGTTFYAISAIFSLQIAQYIVHQYRKGWNIKNESK